EFQVEQIFLLSADRHRLASERHHRLADLLSGRRRRERGAERDGHRVGNPPGPLPEEAPYLAAEDAPPEPIEMDRDDRDVESLHDLLKPLLEGEHIPGPADRSLRKNADHMALPEFFSGPHERLDHLLAVSPRDRDR